MVLYKLDHDDDYDDDDDDLVHLVEYVLVGDVAVVDFQRRREQLKEVVVVLKFFLHEQVAVIVDDALLQILANLTVFLYIQPISK